MTDRKIVRTLYQATGVVEASTEIDIEYKDNFVAFLDVLGFKEMVFSNLDKDKERLAKYFDVVDYFKSAFKKISLKTEIEILAVSDSMILTLPVKINEGEINQLRQFCIGIGLIQQHLAMNNIWLRGAITRGQVAHRPEDSFILGPAYINAFELEKKAAKFPRVILDSKLIDSLGAITAQDLIEKVNANISYENWKGDILYDWGRAKRFDVDLIQDAPLFIDYLQKCFEKENGYESLKLHIAENISSNIKEKTDVYEKYRWVTDYYLSKFRMAPVSNANDQVLHLLSRL